MHVYVKGSSPWLDEHVKSYIQQYVPDAVFMDEITHIPTDAKILFQFCDGCDLNRHFGLLNTAQHGLINAYPNSDALARKDHLARAVEHWTAKRPESLLKGHVPLTVRLSLDYSEYVEDALTAADDLTLLDSLEENEEKPASEREWWILKPAMIDCGDGIRIFSTIAELADNLELAANIEDDGDDRIDEDSSATAAKEADSSSESDTNQFVPNFSLPGLSSLDALITATGKIRLTGNVGETLVVEEGGRILSSRLREFVAQQYIVSIPPIEKRKWHVRAYALAMGRLKVHVFCEMLTLLALEDYEPPWENPSLKASLTNTSLQGQEEMVEKESMRLFWESPDELLPGDWKENVFDQVCGISAELFRAAAYTMADKFIPIDKCFELFAIDFLVDTNGAVWLLEVNETPAFYQEGVAGPLAQRLMRSVVSVAMEHMGEFDGRDLQHLAAREMMVEILDESEKLGKSNITEILPEK